jgi:ApaG protein
MYGPTPSSSRIMVIRHMPHPRCHWKITDAKGLTQEVRGEGVIGEQPVLKPGEVFRYTSGTSLGTASGVMLGEYEMVTPEGERFEVEVPAFSLDSPYQMGRPN